MLFTKLDLPPLKLPELWYDKNNIEFKSSQTEGYVSYHLQKKAIK